MTNYRAFPVVIHAQMTQLMGSLVRMRSYQGEDAASIRKQPSRKCEEWSGSSNPSLQSCRLRRILHGRYAQSGATRRDLTRLRRALFRGIVRYSRLHGPWAFYVTPGDFEQVLPRIKSWGGTGIIARIETPEVARAILASGLPAIALDLSEDETRAGHPLGTLSEVASDSHSTARMAAEHLLERGFPPLRLCRRGRPGLVGSSSSWLHREDS